MALLAILGWAAGASGATYLYSDSPGVWKRIDTAGMKPRVPKPAPTTKATPLMFALTFQDFIDGETFGFNDAVRGAARRAVAQQVANDVAAQLSYVGVTLDIYFSTSQMDGAGYLASAGTYYQDVPGLVDGLSLQHAQLGSDPAVLLEDIYCTVDFGFTWNDAYPANPMTGEFDLYSVLLHELTHGLGFTSLSNSSGGPAIGFANPAYTKVNDLLARGNGFDLWATPGPPFFKGVPSDLIGDNVIFTGQQATAAYGGTNPPIYALNPFLAGTSLSHWSSSVVGGAIMVPAIAPGVTNRTYAPVDLGALRDIGWQLVGTPFPTPTPSPTPNFAPDWAIYE